MSQTLLETKRLYSNIGKIITSSLDIDSILLGIMSEIDIFFHPKHWSFLRLDPNTEELFFVLTKGISLQDVRHVRLGSEEGIAGYVASHKETVYVPDVRKDPRFSDKVDQLTGYNTGCILAVPIIYLNNLYGVIELVSREQGPDVYNNDDRLVLESIADFSAIAFANSTAFSILVDLADTDMLTGVYNQNKLEKIIVELENPGYSHRRSHQASYLLMVFFDIDDFKEVNDTFGHRAGDRVLRDFTRHLRSLVRTEDLLFRVGGDEFLLIIFLSDEHSLEPTKKRLTTLLDSAREIHSGDKISVNISYGMASGPCEKAHELIHLADMEMYNRKNTGKSKNKET